MSRVLLVGRGAPEKGGIPTYLQTLRESDDLGQQHDIGFLNQSRGDAREAGRLTMGNVRRLVRDAYHLWIAAEGYDLVHLHSAMAPAATALRAGAFVLVARARGCRVIVHAHGGLLLLWMTTPRRRTLVRLVLAGARRVLTVSSEVQNALLSTLQRPVELVENGVDVTRFTPAGTAQHDPPRILYVGLLTPRKGVLDLIEASRLLEERQVPHALILVGGSPSEGGAAEAEVRNAVTGSSATLLGERAPAEMPVMYREADVFCLAAWYEAMPLSILEALATGLPVVATKVGDVARVVRPGETGGLVPPRDPVALADALEPLLRDRELRGRLGRNARRLVEQHFSSAETTRALAQVYREETRS